MSAIKLSAQKIQDVSHLKKIAEAWKIYTVDNSWGPIATVPRLGLLGGFELVHYLSGGSLGSGWQGQARSILNDPYIYVAQGDRYASKVKTEVISVPMGGDANAHVASYEFSKNDISNILASNKVSVSLSYCTIAGLSASVPLATTPVAFTRGLKANGTWHSKYGLYGDKGGYVVFCDGHATWFDGSRQAKFLKWDQSGYTSDIRDAIPNNAFISSGWNLVNNIKDTDDSLLLIYHAGTGGA
ncbi:MAG: hypothetical protein LBJ13_02450 [Puniceicoccales bacterium]|nr:hypothetical protein [Puniceicoccales bacterium]